MRGESLSQTAVRSHKDRSSHLGDVFDSSKVQAAVILPTRPAPAAGGTKLPWQPPKRADS